MSTPKTYKILNYNYRYLRVIVGSLYTAIGTCGLTDGVIVTGKLVKIDNLGAYLEDNNGQPHLCNERTLKPFKK